ncbi:hypothetical protein Psuf_037970 [Phytohabitans suffuscus]|uniref:Uncharacterized protein n=1 Tax=Phytohabitans suffuscus TaxID=624315 RepID=A0A6F8YK30_9ACTN|nr:hypothetical protein Psuf_037970 [Phytohabitans suffuscus]
MLRQAAVDHLGERRALFGGPQARAAGVLGEHRPLLQDRPGVSQDAVDRHTGDARDVVGRLAGADAGLDVAG